MSDTTEKARELLVAEYVKEGRIVSAKETMEGCELQAHAEYIVIRAIRAALSEKEQPGQVPAASLDELMRHAASNYPLVALVHALNKAAPGFKGVLPDLSAVSAPQPASAVPEDVLRDAERYRFIRHMAEQSRTEWGAVDDAAFSASYGNGHNFDLNIDDAMLAAAKEGDHA